MGNGGMNETDNDSSNGDETTDDEPRQSNLYFAKAVYENSTPLGLIVSLVFAIIIIFILLIWLCKARRANKRKDALRYVNAQCKVIPSAFPLRGPNSVYDVHLGVLSKESTDTEKSDG